jgi:P4 family phage/plasmid primase-like protien
VFYKFETHRWYILAEEELFRDVMNFIGDRYDNLLLICAEDEREKVRKLAHKAGMYNFINNVVKTIKNIACDSNFKEKLNQNRYLLGFDNGILDLKTKEFRDGLPSDYITHSCGYDFIEEYDEDRMQFLKKIIKNTMCDDEHKYKSLIEMLGRTLIGDNSITNQKFYCWYGYGKNGKTSLQNLICETLGDYYKNPPTSLMTQNEQRSDGHNADICNLVGSRFCFMSETKDGFLNPQSLKKHTGENKLEYRAVYGRVKHSTYISWTPVLVSNDKIKLNADDFGVMRRFVYIPFKACFVSNPENYTNVKDGRKYYKSIENFDGVLKSHRNEFIHLLLQNCNYNQKLEFCDEIDRETNELVKSQDMLLDMLKTLFIKVDNQPNQTHPTGISLDTLKKILYDSNRNPNALLLKQMKSANRWTESDFVDKIKTRIEDAFNISLTGTGGQSSKIYRYVDVFGVERNGRRVFFGITLNDENKEDEDDECFI